MADHFYSIVAEGQAMVRQNSSIVVGTSATTGNPIEVRITDGAMTAREVYSFLEWLADLIAARDGQVIPGGTLK